MATQDHNQLFADNVSKAFSAALAKQPAIVRRKDSLNNATGAILQVANLVVGFTTGLPAWVSVSFAVVIGILQIVYSATTPGALTPSQQDKILAEATKIDLSPAKSSDHNEANVLGTLLNIFDAVNNQRRRERAQDPSDFGLPAHNEPAPEAETKESTAEVVTGTVLDELRSQVAAHA